MSSSRKRGPITTVVVVGQSRAQVAGIFRITKTEGMGPRFREDDDGVFVEVLRIFRFSFQTATPSRSRGAMRPSFASERPALLIKRACGTPGAQCTRSLACKRVTMHTS